MYRVQSSMLLQPLWVVLSFLWASVVPGIPVDDSCHPWACESWWKIYCQRRSCRHQRRGSTWCPALCAGFCLEPALHTKKFLLGIRFDNVVWICCYRWEHCIKSSQCPVECCGFSMCDPGHKWSVCLLGSGSVASTHCQRLKWALV